MRAMEALSCSGYTRATLSAAGEPKSEKEFHRDVDMPELLVFRHSVHLTEHPLYQSGDIILQDKVCTVGVKKKCPYYSISMLYVRMHYTYVHVRTRCCFLCVCACIQGHSQTSKREGSWLTKSCDSGGGRGEGGGGINIALIIVGWANTLGTYVDYVAIVVQVRRLITIASAINHQHKLAPQTPPPGYGPVYTCTMYVC